MNRLKEYRNKANMTQRELAAIAGITLITISSIENNRTEPKISTAIAISKALNVGLKELWDVES